ncbi:MAG: glycoside hydrolase family 30 beta sandwich domain-containing protein [Bacteroidota bacterium]
MRLFHYFTFGFLLIFLVFQSCSPPTMSTSKIIVTSEAGDQMAERENVDFQRGETSGNIIEIFPDQLKQTLDGIGSSFTESSAFVLAHLTEDDRKEVMRNIYSDAGANFSLTRTHVGACDFSVEGKYSYADIEGDVELAGFTIAPDHEGFSKEAYPDLDDVSYDLLPMIEEAMAIKADQEDKDLRIIASAWTAPAWMKDIEEWYIPGAPENNYQGTGGSLKPEYEATYADYILKYLDAYAEAGVDIWGLTPVNEPHGNNGQWESMHFTPESQNTFIKTYLGPKLQASDHADLKVLMYDQNRNGLEEWTSAILGDEETAEYVYGTAVHWYESTFNVYEDELVKAHESYPDHAIIHTEGCIDDLGKPAPPGIGDPDVFQEEGWFQNDDFWWNANATDWAYTAPWAAPSVEEHPMYTPVHRYARNIIVSIDHWMSGWVDWNVVLDHNGGPNHVGNFCGAPIMINTETDEVYYTPVFYVLAQFSRSMRPGDQVVQTQKTTSELDEDALHACASLNTEGLLSVQLLNTTKEVITYQLKIGDQYAEIELDANSVQTVQVAL